MNLSKTYGTQVLFDQINFQVGPEERLGILGRNGYGKTTLFRLILGQEHPDDGEILIPKHYRISHLDQHIEFSKPTVLEEACLGLPAEQKDHQFQVEKVLMGLGLDEEMFSQSPLKLSGGYQIRLNLAKVLVSDPDLLLLDEPTNYLDILSLRWLERFLINWPKAVMLITHDRQFMDRVTTHTLGIKRQKVKKIAGKTSKYIEQIEMEDEVYEKTRQNEEAKRKTDEAFINRFRAKATKAKAVQARIKALDKRAVLQQLEKERELIFQFPSISFPGKVMMEAEEVAFSYGPDLPQLFNNLKFTVGKKDRIGVIGQNGKGKSTLFKLLAGFLKPIEGQISCSPNTSLGYFGQMNIERLNNDNTVVGEIMSAPGECTRERAKGISGLMMFPGELGEKKVEVLSGGERSRVLLGKLLAQNSNLLMLDEPSNHLDMESTESLIRAIKRYEGAVLIVTHSEMILEEVADRLIVFRPDKVEVFNGSYADFLEKGGWDDQDTSLSNSKEERKPAEGNKKLQRKQRSEIIMERSKSLGPLKKQMDTIEAEIVELEEQIEKDNQTLIEAAEGMTGEKIAQLSKDIKMNQQRVDSLFDQLAELTEQHDVLAEEFNERLKELS